jgi:hypothetical protein
LVVFEVLVVTTAGPALGLLATGGPVLTMVTTGMAGAAFGRWL